MGGFSFGGPDRIRLHFRFAKIYVRLRQAVAGAARPQRIESFESDL